MSLHNSRLYFWSSSSARREPALEPWRNLLENARADAEESDRIESDNGKIRLAERQLCYVIDAENTRYAYSKGLNLEICIRKRNRNGAFDAPKRLTLAAHVLEQIQDADDRLIFQLLVGSADEWGNTRPNRRHVLLPQNFEITLRRICQTGRCLLRRDHHDVQPLTLEWDDGPPWIFGIALGVASKKQKCALEGFLVRGDERRSLKEPHLILRGGVVFIDNAVARLDDGGVFQLLASLREQSPSIPAAQAGDFLRDLYKLPRVPPIDLPPSLRLTVQNVKPSPRLHIGAAPATHPGSYGDPHLPVKVTFDYQGRFVPALPAGQGEFLDDRTVLLRDRDVERAALRRLFELGFQQAWDRAADCKGLALPQKKLADAVLRLTAEGWHVEADGHLYRQAGEFKLELNSAGIDWFDLDGKMEFGDQTISLPRLLESLREGKNTVILDDGTIGLLPAQWLKKYGVLAGVGRAEGESLRFGSTQIGLLDALLAAMPEARVDEVFKHARKQLAEFSRIEAAEPAASFTGELRPYQREGLGWLQFLQKFRFGGCLADDMGLGKTVQVLALLESRRLGDAGPSLVVLPRSLVFNWLAEAKRFTPDMRVLDQSGAGRIRGVDHLRDYDLILSTYGTLRKDAGVFKDFEFDYVILDEAQAIKNAATESAKAARLLRGRHRLAMSGTPIENRLAELWSLFEFLNPGMLGNMKAFGALTAAKDATEDPDAVGRQILAKTLRPFILRRTKSQVATDLPAKTEQTIYCELEADQRKLYDELRDHYRAALLGRISEVGLNKSKIQVLEALLRLRQAACHPALIDKSRAKESSAKLDTLLGQLQDVLAEGHKALVFSQFTSLLSIVKKRLDANKVNYEYLDGKTRDRDARVQAFQNNPACNVFLISLKAGGVGLNLTAADYVFLLDPWWNPAVEAQAIDRTHRIGQTRQVFAYRLIAKDTVEEKVLELQKTKKDLADAIINADNGLIASLGKEELELLLS